MAIYTPNGCRVKFLSARIVKIWTTLGNIGNGYELKWHYTEPTPRKSWRKGVEIETMDVWHVMVRYDDDRPGHGGTKPWGSERAIANFVADNGIREILDECYHLNPADAEAERKKFQEAA